MQFYIKFYFNLLANKTDVDAPFIKERELFFD